MITADETKPRRKGGNGLILLVLAAIVVFALMKALTDSGPVVDAVGWQKDFDAAQQVGREQDKPLLLYFTASWCGPCQRMKREVFSQEEVGTLIRSKAVPVMMDVTNPDEKTETVAQKYGVGSIPTLILTNADGMVLAKHTGYIDVDALRAWLSKDRTARVTQGSR